MNIYFIKLKAIISILVIICSYQIFAIETPRPISGRDPSVVSDIIPADVLARVNLLRRELELVRFEMGKPKIQIEEMLVDNVEVHEVYFQSLTLLQKANRLSFEHTRTASSDPISPTGQIRSAHVWGVVDLALNRILLVKNKISNARPLQESLESEEKTPSDVFRSIIQANRQLDAMLVKQISPSDVYQRISQGINYAERLLENFPGIERIPKADLYERGKIPKDVYLKVIECFDIVHDIAKISGIPVMDLNIYISRGNIEIKPSDVYDVAGIVLSKLDNFHAYFPGSETPAKVYYPGIKFPSHVYQRVSILKKQLTLLRERVKADPNWGRIKQ